MQLMSLRAASTTATCNAKQWLGTMKLRNLPSKILPTWYLYYICLCADEGCQESFEGVSGVVDWLTCSESLAQAMMSRNDAVKMILSSGKQIIIHLCMGRCSCLEFFAMNVNVL